MDGFAKIFPEEDDVSFPCGGAAMRGGARGIACFGADDDEEAAGFGVGMVRGRGTATDMPERGGVAGCEGRLVRKALEKPWLFHGVK